MAIIVFIVLFSEELIKCKQEKSRMPSKKPQKRVLRDAAPMVNKKMGVIPVVAVIIIKSTDGKTDVNNKISIVIL